MPSFGYPSVKPAEARPARALNRRLRWKGFSSQNGNIVQIQSQTRSRTVAYVRHEGFLSPGRSPLSEADRQAYTAAYARLGRMRAGWAYFISFPQTAKHLAQLSKTKLIMPVLAIGGEKSLGAALGQQMKLVASDVKVVVLKDTGHWVLEERPQETTDALLKFL